MTRLMGLCAVVMALGMVGCTGGGRQVRKADVAEAKARFYRLEGRREALKMKMDLWMRRYLHGNRGAKDRMRYAFQRQMMLKISTELRKLLKSYIRLGTSLPRGKLPHRWTYAAFARSAEMVDEVGIRAARVRRFWKAKGRSIYAAYFGRIARTSRRQGYRSYLTVLFLGDYFHSKDPQGELHTLQGNRWLRRANRRRCQLSRMLRISRSAHASIAGSIFHRGAPEFVESGDTRQMLREFREKGAMAYCGS